VRRGTITAVSIDTAPSKSDKRPVALVTGVGRSIGIAASIAAGLTADGWTVATAGWRGYDARMPWGADTEQLAEFEADMTDALAPAQLFASVNATYGPVRALVMCHCESIDSSILTTTVASFDRHFAVNARSIWLLIKAFAEQFTEPPDGAFGRIVAITSDHTAHNLPYGASKGALDRIVLAAAEELSHLGLTGNVINPGATDTGWMSDEIKDLVESRNLQPRVGLPSDVASLARFLCSPAGVWINRQLLYSDGGLRS
jgi:3-oxoacyl-[acyl-carrier protein] reductase